MAEVGTRTAGGLGEEPHRHGVDRERAVGIVLSQVDGVPSSQVDDRIGCGRGHGVEHLVAVGDVEPRTIVGRHLPSAGREQGRRLAPDLPSGTSDQNPSGSSHRAQAVLSATGARSRSGSHHAALAAYQSMVSAMPASQEMVGSQPSSRWIFDQSST